MKDEDAHYGDMMKKVLNYMMNNWEELQTYRHDRRYRRMESPIEESIDNTVEVDIQEEEGLHPLIIDGQNEVKEATEDMPKSAPYRRESWLGYVDIMFGKIKVRIGRCSKSDLLSLIKEMEETVC